MNITQQLCCPGAAENQDYIRLGEDRYSLGDGGSGLALGAASYEVDGVSWVPAEVFTRLGHSGQALTGSVMHLSGRME